jgi:hypothetical protein
MRRRRTEKWIDRPCSLHKTKSPEKKSEKKKKKQRNKGVGGL